jgi:threonine/homoserine/homoserine lactone efflux protein
MRNPHAGALIALGHGVVELPLMILIYLGLGYIFKYQDVKASVSLAGGLMLLIMAISLFKSIKQVNFSQAQKTRSSFLSGVLFSIGNPYFLIWWATVGAALVATSATFGAFGFIIFAIVHWLCDLIWFYILSAFSFRGGLKWGEKFIKPVIFISAIFLILFGIGFIIEGIKLFIL